MFRNILNGTLTVSKTGIKCLTPLLHQTHHCTSRTMTSAMSSTSEQKFEVLHDEDAEEFSIDLPMKTPDGASTCKAVLQYCKIKPDFVDLVHTGVPVEFRGHGIAKVLAQTAFDYFVEKKIDMQPSCTYLQKFYKENPLPQYRERVKWDSSL